MNKSGTAASWHLCWHLALMSDIPITARITQCTTGQAYQDHGSIAWAHDGCPPPCLLLLQVRRPNHATRKAPCRIGHMPFAAPAVHLDTGYCLIIQCHGATTN